MENLVQDSQKKILSKKDLLKYYIRCIVSDECSANFARLQSLSWGGSIAPILVKLYPDKAELKRALQRHLTFFNTEATVGKTLYGALIAMEEEKAQGKGVTEEMIIGIRSGLMGPVAGIGDTLIYGTLKPILISIGISLGIMGNPLAILFPALVGISFSIFGWIFLNYGYSLGRNSIENLMHGEGAVSKLIKGAAILGMFMMGALSSSIVKVKTSISFDFGGVKPFQLQSMLDSLAPGLLSLITIFIVYSMIKKGVKVTKIIVSIIGISIIGSFLGIF